MAFEPPSPGTGEAKGGCGSGWGYGAAVPVIDIGDLSGSHPTRHAAPRRATLPASWEGEESQPSVTAVPDAVTISMEPSLPTVS
jgi:hypothetical protein